MRRRAASVVPEKGQAETRSATLCSAHGLRYDPALHVGCVVCRREAAAVAASAVAPAAPEPAPARERLRLIALSLIAGVLACVLVVLLARDFGVDAHALVEYARELTGQAPPRMAHATQVAPTDPSADTSATAASTSALEPAAANAVAAAAAQAAAASDCTRSAFGLDSVHDVAAASAAELQRAAAHGDTAKVAQELDLGARIDELDAGGRTALAWAAATGHLEVARALLDAGANPNLAGQDEVSPLMLAAENGAPELVTALLEHGARVNAADAHARSALMYAARANRSEVISVLLRRGAALEARCELGMTALHYAAENCECIDAVERLLAARGDVDAADMRGATALMLAAQAGHADVVTSLLDGGARLDARDHQGWGAVDYVVRPREGLDAALQHRLFAVLQLLIDRDPEPRLGQDASQVPILFRAQLDEWLRARKLPALPAYAPREARVEPAPRADDSHASVRLFGGLSPTNSRSLPTWLYPECSLNFHGFLARVPNIVQQVRISGLSLRTGQQLTLSADAAGNTPWEVDDAILIERMQGFTRGDSAFAGRADAMWIAQQPVRRLGPQSFRYSRGAIDFTPWLSTGGGADRVLVSVLDYGGSAMLSDIWLHVNGPHAASTLKDVTIEALQPPK
jgi:ankyrin repeat protein